VRSARLKAVLAVVEVGRAFRALVSYTTDGNHKPTSTTTAEYNTSNQSINQSIITDHHHHHHYLPNNDDDDDQPTFKSTRSTQPSIPTG